VACDKTLALYESVAGAVGFGYLLGEPRRWTGSSGVRWSWLSSVHILRGSYILAVNHTFDIYLPSCTSFSDSFPSFLSVAALQYSLLSLPSTLFLLRKA
jgi:hypothetical protein